MERKRVKGRFVKETDEEKTERAQKPAAVGAPRPKNCRTFARKRMEEALPEIVQALVKNAKKGSVPHTKALAELSGLTKNAAATKPAKRRGKSFVAELLEEMGEE